MATEAAASLLQKLPLRTQRVLRALARYRYAVVTLVAFLSCFQHLNGTGGDWFYFHEGSRLLFGGHVRFSLRPGGLHLYANYPDFQIGPLSLLVATPFRLLGPGDGRIPASLCMTAFVVLLIWVLERTATSVWPARDELDADMRAMTVLFGGAMVAQAWAPLAAIYAHLDDVLALGACVGALWAVATRRPVLLGLFIGAAVAAKPWGVLAFPLALALDGRDRVRAFAVGGAIAAAAWLPFVLADSRTLHAATPQNLVSSASIIHLFGVTATDGPTWTRPVQLFAMLALGAIAVWRGRWGAVLLVGVSARLVFDPQVFLYYTSGLVLGAFAWDLLRSRRPLPLATLFTFVFLNDAYVLVGDATSRAALRLVLLTGLTAVALFGPAQATPVVAAPA